MDFFYFLVLVVLCSVPGTYSIIEGSQVTTVIPYLFSVRNVTEEDKIGVGKGFKCSAVLINYNCLLTVQSCVAKVDGDTVTENDPWDFVVVGGGLDIKDLQSNSIHKSTLIKIILNKLYKPSTQYANVAILWMSIPVPRDSEQVKPINRVLLTPKEGTNVVIQGWGTSVDNKEPYTPTQREGKASIFSRSSCTSSRSTLPPKTLCDKSSSPSGQCTGDEGGAMVLDGLLVGILLYNDLCDTSSVPGMVLDVVPYDKWIHGFSLTPALLGNPVLIILMVFRYLVN